MTLKRQAEFLRSRLLGTKIIDSYTRIKNEWVIAVDQAGKGSGYLQLSCDGQYPYLLYLESNHRGRNSTRVVEEIIGMTISDVRVLPGERVISIHFTHFDGELLLQLFTNHTNFFLVDSQQRIRNSFKERRKHVTTRYHLPENTKIDPLTVSFERFQQLLKEQTRIPLRKSLPLFSYMTSTVIREILYRCSIGEQLTGKELEEGDLRSLYREIQSFFNEIQTATPLIYRDGDLPLIFSLTFLKHLRGMPCEEFENLNTALKVFNFQALKYRQLMRRKKRFEEQVNRRLTSLQSHLNHLKKHRADPVKEAYYRKIGQLLISQPHLLKSGAQTVTLTDYFQEDLPLINVAVNPGLSVRENAEIYFQKAKQYHERIHTHDERQKDLTRHIEQLRKFRERLEVAGSLKELDQIERALKKGGILQPEARDAGKYRLPYKRYFFRNFEIWVGRNARDNESMTFKCANKEDFWFHVQGYSGSHLILRNPDRRGSFPKEVIEYAAGLAVTFSGAKHASYVPVVYTRVKHLRKPRKSPPGAVVPAQVKTVFVDPIPL